MILSDDNFATIVYAVEQGRKIFDNLTKYIRFVLVLLVVFVLTFLGATLFNIAAGEPFTPPQVLWIHFVVNAAFGFSLGFDYETPGLMSRVPKPRGRPVLTPSLLTTVGLAGLLITIGLLSMIEIGTDTLPQHRGGHLHRLHRLRALFDCGRARVPERDRLRLTTDTFSSRQMNRTILLEFVLAVLITQLDVLRRILGTTELTFREFTWALVPPVVCSCCGSSESSSPGGTGPAVRFLPERPARPGRPRHGSGERRPVHRELTGQSRLPRLLVGGLPVPPPSESSKGPGPTSIRPAVRDVAQLGGRACFGSRRSGVQIPASRPLTLPHRWPFLRQAAGRLKRPLTVRDRYGTGISF